MKDNNAKQHGANRKKQLQKQRRQDHVVRGVAVAAALVLALIILVPMVNAQRNLLAMRRVDDAVITLPPQQVDTLYIATAVPTATPVPTPTPAPVRQAAAVVGSELEDGGSEPLDAEPEEWADAPDDEDDLDEGIPDDEADFVDDDPDDAGLDADDGAQAAAALLASAGEAFEYLPVVNEVDTDKKVIAITVDDCFQVGNLQKIIAASYKVGGKLTIFPIGQNLSLQGMSQTLKQAVKLGYELENHTWSHARVFRMTEAEMAKEIWDQDQALNQCLGVTYKEHFFRCMGGDGELDQRTHNFLKQLGYQGVAHWSISGSDATPEQIAKHLHPGAVYLFHTTDKDTKVLQKFIPWAAKQGYKLVTLNELVGLPANEVSAYSAQQMPEPQPYTPDYRTIHTNEYSWMVVQLQNKLRAMGYLEMDGASTGYYGKQTAAAVAAFQSAVGLPATGEADAATQQSILAAA